MREFLQKAVTDSVDASAINLVKERCELSSLPSVLKLTRLGVVEVERKISSTTTATNSKDLFRISSLHFIFTNGLAKKSLLSIMLIGIAPNQSLSIMEETEAFIGLVKYTRAN